MVASHDKLTLAVQKLTQIRTQRDQYVQKALEATKVILALHDESIAHIADESRWLALQTQIEGIESLRNRAEQKADKLNQAQRDAFREVFRLQLVKNRANIQYVYSDATMLAE